jgi:hypothetical protein
MIEAAVWLDGILDHDTLRGARLHHPFPGPIKSGYPRIRTDARNIKRDFFSRF